MSCQNGKAVVFICLWVGYLNMFSKVLVCWAHRGLCTLNHMHIHTAQHNTKANLHSSNHWILKGKRSRSDSWFKECIPSASNASVSVSHPPCLDQYIRLRLGNKELSWWSAWLPADRAIHSHSSRLTLLPHHWHLYSACQPLKVLQKSLQSGSGMLMSTALYMCIASRERRESHSRTELDTLLLYSQLIIKCVYKSPDCWCSLVAT